MTKTEETRAQVEASSLDSITRPRWLSVAGWYF